MTALHDRSTSAEREDWETDLDARIETVFARYPALCGFSVAERLVPAKDVNAGMREWELYISDIAAYPDVGPGQSKQFCGEISAALAVLCNQRPEMAELLSGRTFARAWH
jgi:hypothetical protein